MKVLLSSFLLLLSTLTYAQTTHTIQVLAMTYSPDSITVNVGDTVRWQWVEGIHTVWTQNFPQGAPVVFENIDQNNPTITYVAQVPGLHRYLCYVHAGMDGVFNVLGTTGVNDRFNTAPVVNSYPSPFTNTLHVQTQGIDRLTLYNAVGQLVYTSTIDRATMQLNLPQLPAGVYFLNGVREEEVVVTQKVLKR